MSLDVRQNLQTAIFSLRLKANTSLRDVLGGGFDLALDKHITHPACSFNGEVVINSLLKSVV